MEAGVIPEDEWWEVQKALYGLQSSPADWSAFRDAAMTQWKWKSMEKENEEYFLNATGECNL